MKSLKRIISIQIACFIPMLNFWMLVIISNIISHSYGDGLQTESKRCTQGTTQYPTVPLSVDSKSTSYSGVGVNPAKFSVQGKQTLLRLNKYYGVKRDRFYVKNNGETMVIQFEESEQKSEATIRGEKWDSEYVLSKGMFFWGNEDGNGPQHTIESQSNSLELQLIHFSKKYKSLELAAKQKAGVLITCVLFESVGKANADVQPLARAALSTTFPNTKLKQVHGPLDLKKLFPDDPMYFQYVAPTNFLPCSEQATWIVFRRPVAISAFQLTYFRGMRNENNTKIGMLFGKSENATDSNRNIFASSKQTQLIVKPVTVLNNSAGDLRSIKATLLIVHFLNIFHIMRITKTFEF